MKIIKNLKIKIFIVTIFILLTSASSILALEKKTDDDRIVISYSFETPKLNQLKIGNTIYDQISLTDSSNNNKAGEPDLPAFGVKILLPQGSKISNIQIIPGKKIYLGSDYNIIPSRSPVRLSEKNHFFNIFKDDSIYKSERLFPELLYQEIGTYFFRGYEILILNLYPIQYKPINGELYYFKDITVIISTDKTGIVNPLFRNTEKDYNDLIKKIDNPLTADSYKECLHNPLSSDNYDLLILTTEDLKSNFEPLKNKHDNENIITKIKTLEDIYLLPQSVTTEDIRDFIKDEYINNGIQYVLLGGDDNIVPAKDLWVSAWNGGDTTFMPSDLYYACLDGTYNFDEDNKWGEPTDGDEGNDVDLISEIYIGRACVSNNNETDNFVNKTISYIDYGGYLDVDVLMVGELLWTNPITWGGDYMDQIINGSSVHYTTVGIPAIDYNIETLYDRDWGGNDWPKSELINKINTGSKIINHLGHSGYDYNMKLENDDISSLTNSDACFIYSQGCNSGGFDIGDCIAEYLTVKTKYAAFAVVMNARYGWGVKGGTDGASQRYHRQFWDAVFGENIVELGKANQDSKEDNINLIFGDCMRWCYYQTNLLGDPALYFKITENNNPNQPNRPTGETFGGVNKEYVFTSSATDLDGDDLYYKWDFGDGTFSDWVGPYNSGDIIEVKHKWSKIGIYQVKVKARDEHRAESEWSEPISLILPVFKQFPLINLFFDILEKFFPRIYSILNL